MEDHSQYIEGTRSRETAPCHKAAGTQSMRLSVPNSPIGSIYREADSRQEILRSYPTIGVDQNGVELSPIRRDLPSLSPQRDLDENNLHHCQSSRRTIDIAFPDLSTSTRSDELCMLRRCEAWSEDSMENRTHLSLASRPEEQDNCIYRFQRHHSTMADSANSSEGITLYWDNRLGGSADLHECIY